MAKGSSAPTRTRQQALDAYRSVAPITIVAFHAGHSSCDGTPIGRTVHADMDRRKQ